jgi:hypothetical protein
MMQEWRSFQLRKPNRLAWYAAARLSSACAANKSSGVFSHLAPGLIVPQLQITNSEQCHAQNNAEINCDALQHKARTAFLDSRAASAILGGYFVLT